MPGRRVKDVWVWYYESGIERLENGYNVLLAFFLLFLEKMIVGEESNSCPQILYMNGLPKLVNRVYPFRKRI